MTFLEHRIISASSVFLLPVVSEQTSANAVVKVVIPTERYIFILLLLLNHICFKWCLSTCSCTKMYTGQKRCPVVIPRWRGGSQIGGGSDKLCDRLGGWSIGYCDQSHSRQEAGVLSRPKWCLSWRIVEQNFRFEVTRKKTQALGEMDFYQKV